MGPRQAASTRVTGQIPFISQCAVSSASTDLTAPTALPQLPCPHGGQQDEEPPCREPPYVDSSIGLDVFHVGGGQAQLPAAALGRADDAGGDGVLQGEGAAHGHHKLALPHLRGAAQGQGGQRVLEERREDGEWMGGNEGSVSEAAVLTFGLILMVAMSATWSTSCTTASYCSPLASFTRTRRRFATTCALVTMSPSGDTRKPEPLEMGTSRPKKGCLQDGHMSGKGSRDPAGSAGDSGEGRQG